MHHQITARFRVILITAVLISMTTAAEESLVTIDIPAADLSTALSQFTTSTGVVINFDSGLTQGKTTPGLRGNYRITDALTRLLQGSALEVVAESDGSYRVIAGQSGMIALEPVLVTGERVERTVFETPSSVVVVTGSEMEETPAIRNVEEVIERVPNITTLGIQNLAPAIRGLDTTGILQGGNSFLGGARPRATITLDGRPLSYNEYIFSATSVYDLERIEVFRGPQTTSQGVNSIAGATYVVTRDPTFESEGEIRIQGGNRQQRQVSGFASGPIAGDQLAGRLAVDYQEQKSFVDYNPTVDYADPEQFENLMVRAKLLWEPAAVPDLSTMLTFSHTESQGPQTEGVGLPFSALNSAIANRAVWEPVANTFIHDLSYTLSDSLELVNKLAITDYSIERIAPPGEGNATIDALDVVNEIQLQFAAPDRRFSGVLGAYLQYTDSDETVDIGNGDFKDRSNSLGLFGELTYQFTPRLDAILGLRYQRDNQDRAGSLFGLMIDYDETFDALLPKFALGYNVNDDVRIGAVISKGFNPGGTTASFATGAQDTFDEETVWNYELFTRGRFFDDRLAVNLNLFYSDFSGLQKFTFVDAGPGQDPIIETSNADKARSFGLEATADLQINDQWQLFAGLGLLDTQFVEFDSALGTGVEGNEFANAPPVTFSAGLDYQPSESLSLGARVRYSASYFSDDDNTPEFKIDSYVVTDLRASYRLSDLELYGYVNNVFDEFYLLTEFDDQANVGTPREFGIGLRYRF